jgi:hypothetical protein
MGLGCQPNAQLPTRVSLFIWNLTLDLSSLGDPGSSYATAGIALEIIGAHKPHCHDKMVTPLGGITVFTRIKDNPAYKMTPPSQSSIFRKIPIFTLVRFLCHLLFAYLIFWN